MIDGRFEVKRPISADTKENCPICKLPAKQVFDRFPIWGMKGGHEPDFHKDPVEYEGWQRSTWKKWEDECHVDNMGTTPVSTKKLLHRTDGK